MLDQDNEGGTFGGLEITRRRILFTSGGLNAFSFLFAMQLSV
jgi:hypothetical protein